MEELTKFLVSCELASPLSCWIGGAVILLLIFFPVTRKRRGLAIDWHFWKSKVGLRRKRIWVLLILVTMTSILMAMVLANPQNVTKQRVRIYGKPVMAIIDVSGSMDSKPRKRFAKDAAPVGERTNLEKARAVFDDMVRRDLEADFGLLIYSTENYIARYFAFKNELLKDTLENKDEISFISTGTQPSAALGKARRFLENMEARDKAIVLISDLDCDLAAIVEMVQEMEKASRAGIKNYVIVIEGGNERAVDGGPRLSQIKDVKAVGINDRHGIDQICSEISEMKSSPIREEETLIRKGLIPFLILPILGLVTLCLILSETLFRKIP